jgi:NADP-dependent 3-hydroxy acid dehydrogenase YdfG
MSTLAGKCVWITGGGSGIGQAAALALAEAGAAVVVSGRRTHALDDTVTKVTARGGVAEAVPADVCDPASVKRAAERILAGHGQVDILVNSAGINTPNRRWSQISPEDWKRVIDTNLNGALYCIAAVLPTMRQRKDGLVINISSWFGRYDGYLAGPAYNTSKQAMAAMSASLNIEECVNGIRSCLIYPGEVATSILKSRPVPPKEEEVARMLQPDDLGRTVRFIAETPARICLNEIVISPTWNRLVLGGEDIDRTF